MSMTPSSSLAQAEPRAAARDALSSTPRIHSQRRLRILTFTTLFPNAIQSAHGIFVEQRLRKLLDSGQVEAKVVAPVPWFPSSNAMFGHYATFARVPTTEQRNGIDVSHPRFVTIPKVGMSSAPWLLAMAARKHVAAQITAGFDFDVLDAHYFYPDGVAAALIGKWLRKPVVITARGTDVNVIPNHRLPRQMICWAAQRCAGIVTVSGALKQSLVELGVDEERIEVLRNGVDLQAFCPLDREAVRRRLDIRGPTLVSVGNLVEGKGHHLVITALRQLDGVGLIVIGQGPMASRLEALASDLGVSERVRFAGRQPHEQLAQYYNAADALVLATAREGMPNVVLESLACGTPVVATRTGGIPEIVDAPESGCLLEQRTPDEIAARVRELLQGRPDRAATRRHAERFSWDETTRGQLRLFARAATRLPVVEP